MKVIETIPPPVTETHYVTEFTERELLIILAHVYEPLRYVRTLDASPREGVEYATTRQRLMSDIAELVNKCYNIKPRLAEVFPEIEIKAIAAQ